MHFTHHPLLRRHLLQDGSLPAGPLSSLSFSEKSELIVDDYMSFVEDGPFLDRGRRRGSLRRLSVQVDSRDASRRLPMPLVLSRRSSPFPFLLFLLSIHFLAIFGDLVFLFSGLSFILLCWSYHICRYVRMPVVISWQFVISVTAESSKSLRSTSSSPTPPTSLLPRSSMIFTNRHFAFLE